MNRKLQQMKTGQMFVILPKQAMQMLDWNKGDYIKLSFDKNKVVLEKNKGGGKDLENPSAIV